MAWIKAKNGNVFEVDDPDLAEQIVKQGHEAFVSDPRAKGSKPAKWERDVDAEPAEADE